MITHNPPMPPEKEKGIIQSCLQSNQYFPIKLKICWECNARKFCDLENFVSLGGTAGERGKW